MARGMVKHKRSPLGTLIREARRRKGLDQATLAKMVGCSPGVISHYETGNYRPSPTRIDELRWLLQIPWPDIWQARHESPVQHWMER